MSVALVGPIVVVIVGLIGCYLGFVYTIKKFKERDFLAFFLLVATIFSFFVLLRGMHFLRVGLHEIGWIK
jgi:hypothetical protein